MSYQILNSKNVCRLCLKSSESIDYVFDSYKISSSRTVRECIEELCGISMSQMNNVSDALCKKCFIILDQSYSFRQQVRKNANILREMFFQTGPSDPTALEHSALTAAAASGDIECTPYNIKEEPVEINEIPEDEIDASEFLDQTSGNLYDEYENQAAPSSDLRINPFYANNDDSTRSTSVNPVYTPSKSALRAYDNEMLVAISAEEFDARIEDVTESMPSNKECPFCKRVYHSSGAVRKHLSLGRCTAYGLPEGKINMKEIRAKFGTQQHQPLHRNLFHQQYSTRVLHEGDVFADDNGAPIKASRRCPVCHKRFSSVRIMYRHYKINCPVRRLRVGGPSFRNQRQMFAIRAEQQFQNELSEGISNAGEEVQNGRTCIHCKKTFSTLSNANLHLKLGRCPFYKNPESVGPKYTKEEKTCVHCNKEFSTYFSLLRHHREACPYYKNKVIIENTIDPNKTESESASIEYKHDLEEILTTHRIAADVADEADESEKEDVLADPADICFENVSGRTCPFCGKEFSQRKNLRTHMKLRRCIRRREREEQREMLARGLLPNPINGKRMMFWSKKRKIRRRCPACCRRFSSEHSMIRHYDNVCPKRKRKLQEYEAAEQNNGTDDAQEMLQSTAIDADDEMGAIPESFLETTYEEGEGSSVVDRENESSMLIVKPPIDITGKPLDVHWQTKPLSADSKFCQHCKKEFISEEGVLKHIHYRRCLVLYPDRENQQKLLQEVCKKEKRRCPLCKRKFSTPTVMHRHFLETCPQRQYQNDDFHETLNAIAESVNNAVDDDDGIGDRDMDGIEEITIQKIPDENSKCKRCFKQLSSKHSLARHMETACRFKDKPDGPFDPPPSENGGGTEDGGNVELGEDELSQFNSEDFSKSNDDSLHNPQSNFNADSSLTQQYIPPRFFNRECPNCHIKFANNQGVTRHLKLKRCQVLWPRVYKSTSTKKCDPCGREFASYYHLDKHRRRDCIVGGSTNQEDSINNDTNSQNLVDENSNDNQNPAKRKRENEDEDEDTDLCSFLTLMQHKITTDLSQEVNHLNKLPQSLIDDSAGANISSDNEEIRQCPLCKVDFPTASDMERHLRLHECGKKDNINDQTNAAEEAGIVKENIEATDGCSSELKENENQIQDHLIIIRSQTICHVCRRCGQEFRAPSLLQEHLEGKCEGRKINE